MSDYERPNIRAMQGYSWGEQPENADTIKLNTNENPYPPSAAVDAALRALHADSLRTYPQPTADRLRDAIAAHHGLQRAQVIMTNGGDEALRLALTTFVAPGAGFGMAEPSYSLYPVLANIHDARLVGVALQDDWRPPADIAAQLNEAGVQLTCLVNPHAPSGTLLDPPQLREIAEALQGVLLIDEAYADFIDPAHGYDTAELVRTLPNVLVLRTFSKGYSLAGLRLGYLLGDAALIDPILSKTRDSYNIDHISQVLGLAAFKDRAHAAGTWSAVRAQRGQLTADLAQLGLHGPASESNFLLATVPPGARLTARDIYQALKQQGILVRYFDEQRLQDKLRITVGTEAQNARLLKALTELMQ